MQQLSRDIHLLSNDALFPEENKLQGFTDAGYGESVHGQWQQEGGDLL